MKKSLSLILVFAMVLSMLPATALATGSSGTNSLYANDNDTEIVGGNPVAVYSNDNDTTPIPQLTGSGTESDPFVVSNETELTNVIERLIENGSGYFTSSIALTGYVPAGYAALRTLDDKYLFGKDPTATVTNMGKMTVAEADYIEYPSDGISSDMPLNFVMSFSADQKDDISTPYDDWYADFVITFSDMDGTEFEVTPEFYLAGFYGETETWEGLWVKVNASELSQLEGKIMKDYRYPVMFGVGMGQPYEYIRSGVQQFLCAMNIPAAVFEANPNMKVTLELCMVDSSDAGLAVDALMATESPYRHQVYSKTFDVDDFYPPVAKIGDQKYTSITDAIENVQSGETITLVSDVKLVEGLVIPADKSVTLDLNGKTVSLETANDAVTSLILNYGNLAITDSSEHKSGKLSYNYTGEKNSDAFNTVESAPGSTLTVENGTVENLSDNCLIAYAIDGLTNGNSGNVTVNIEGGTVTSMRQAIRIFANSTTDVGTLNISGGNITGRVIVQNANDNANKAVLSITGGTFDSNAYKTDVLYVGGSKSATIDIDASVSGGIFKGELTETHVANFITGGTFTSDPTDYLAEGYGCFLNESEEYQVGKKYTLTYIVEGETVSTENLIVGQVPTQNPGTPTKAADDQYTYTFKEWEWTSGSDSLDVVYTAVFTANVNKYPIIWVIDGVSETSDVAYGETPAYADPTKEGYIFTGWSPDVVSVTGPATYTAQWKYNCAKINYVTNGGSAIDSETIDLSVKETFTKPADPTKNGYTFAGWYCEETLENEYSFESRPDAGDDMFVYAKWTENASSEEPAPVDPAPVDPAPVDPAPSTPVNPPVEVPEVNDATIDTSAPTVSTETQENEDGSTTTTETKEDGTVVETTQKVDGSTTTTATKSEVVESEDGSKTTTSTTNTTTTDTTGATVTEQKQESKIEAADGSVTTTTIENTFTTDTEGKVSVESKVEEKVETETGSTTTTTTTTADAEGNTEKTVAEAKTTVDEAGNETTVTTSKTETTHANGSTGTTVMDETGKVTAEVSISEKAVTEAAEAGKAVALPMPAVESADEAAAAPVINVTAAAQAPVTVEIPVTETKPGTVVVLVHEDGTEEVVTKTVQTEGGVAVKVEGNVTVKVVDNAKDFGDTENHWANDAIDHASSRELFNGVNDKDFAPDEVMNRAMLATVLWRMEGKQEANNKSEFDDLEEGHWSEEATHWASEQGIIQGENGSFHGEEAVTREQIVTMLYRMHGSPEVAEEDAVEGASDWAANAVAWAVKIGLMQGDGTSLNLQGNATRAQIATFLMRYMNLSI